MYDPLLAFRPHFNALARVGYFKLVFSPKTKWKRQLHYYYRVFIWIGVITYNLQHVIRAIQVRHYTDHLVGTLFILLTTLNTLGKQLSFNMRVQRIDKIIDTINVYVSSGYSSSFEIAALFEGILISLQGYGHVTMDCTIVSFYAYVKTQLQIFRYNLEHFLDEFGVRNSNLKYIDEDENLNELLHHKFVTCVKHYDKIIWFAREIELMFNEAMIIQFFVMAWVICMTAYKIVGSELVNESIYRSEWLSLSPVFRRRLLIVMERCKRAIEPRTAYIIPMSIDTYISVLRSSYALFTIIDKRK
ncbi:unnamed protein product, partial [Brenthis ino]